MSANDTQVGGDHYKHLSIEPWDVITSWGLGFFDGNAVKYIARWRNKGGVEDLEKARHYLDKLIEAERKTDGLRTNFYIKEPVADSPGRAYALDRSEREWRER